MNIFETETLFYKCFDKIRGTNTDTVTSKKNPSRLVTHLRYLYTQFQKDNYLSKQDYEFLHIFLTTPNRELSNKAYMLGEFVDFKSRGHKVYNIRNGEQVQKAFISRYK